MEENDFRNQPTTLEFPNYESKMLFINKVIELFEEFLEDRKIDIPNDEKKEDESASLIYGTDYGELQDGVECIINNWHGADDIWR